MGRRSWSLALPLVLLLSPACGGVERSGSREPPDAAAKADSGAAEKPECAPGAAPVTSCERFPEGDPECAPTRRLAYGCTDPRRIPEGCTFRLVGCVNCLDWCCPPGSERSTRFASLASEPSDGGLPREGCVAEPLDDATCVLQGKPTHGYLCPSVAADPEHAAPPGCYGNPYGGGWCTRGFEKGYVCCP